MATRGRFFRYSGLISSGLGAFLFFSDFIHFNSRMVNSFSISLLGLIPLKYFASLLLSCLILLLDEDLLMLAYSCMKAFALLFGVTLHRPSYSMAPLYSPWFSPFSPLITFQALLMFFSSWFLLSCFLYTSLFASLVFSLSSVHFSIHSPLLLVMSRLARFPSLLSCLILAVTQGVASFLMTLTGQTLAATSHIRLVSPLQHFLHVILPTHRPYPMLHLAPILVSVSLP